MTSSQIPDPGSGFSSIPDSGSGSGSRAKKAPDPGSGSATLHTRNRYKRITAGYWPVDGLPLCQALQDGHLPGLQLLHQPHRVHRTEEPPAQTKKFRKGP